MKVKTGIESGRGLGDAVADFTHATGLDRLAKFYTRITGKDCGCEERRHKLNQIIPFESSKF
jgi:hypothetical protein